MATAMLPREFVERQKQLYEADAPRRERRKQYFAERNCLAKAAPDLLAALKILSVAYMNVRFPDGEPDFLDPFSPLAVARDAIAKAGGG